MTARICYPTSHSNESTGNGCGCCNLVHFGNFCGRSKADIDNDVKSHLDNRIYFINLTLLGYQKPFREAINQACRDKPNGRPTLEQFLPKPGETPDYAHLAESFRNIGADLGLVDGLNYGRVHRLMAQKIRHMRNPNGTEKRFCIPMTQAMHYGWWMRDKKALDCDKCCSKWYQPRERFPVVRGEITKFVDSMALHDPNFIMF